MEDGTLFARVDDERALPTTSAPAPDDILKALEAAFDEGPDEETYFSVSSKVSGTFDAARTARDLLLERDIAVIDTQSICMGPKFVPLEAAEAAAQGAPKDEVIERAMDVGSRTSLYAALSTSSVWR